MQIQIWAGRDFKFQRVSNWQFPIGNESLPCSVRFPLWRISSRAAVLFCLLFNCSRSPEPLQKKGQKKTSNRSSSTPRDPQGAMGAALHTSEQSCVSEEPHKPAVLPKPRLGDLPPPPSLRHSQVSALAASAAAAAFELSPSFTVRLKKPFKSARPFTVRLRISSIAVPAEAASWSAASGGSHPDRVTF